MKHIDPVKRAEKLIQMKTLIKQGVTATEGAQELGIPKGTWYTWKNKYLTKTNATKKPTRTTPVTRRATNMGAAPYIVEAQATNKLCIVVGDSREVLQALALMART